MHGFYEREFVRRRKTKRNPDGFDHRPTFTLPHPTLHPRWTLFNAPQTSPEGYAHLTLPETGRVAGSVSLHLLTEPRVWSSYDRWVTVPFRADPRLGHFFVTTETRTVSKGKNKGELKSATVYRYRDPQLKRERPAQISGAKLEFRDIKLNADGSLRSATPFLVFACTVEDLALSERAKGIQWSETGESTKTGKARKRKTLPGGLVSCAVDLGIRNLGFVTLAVSGLDASEHTHDGVRVVRSRNQWIGEEERRGKNAGRWAAGPDLSHIGAHKRDIRRLRRLRGKPVAGERSHAALQEHIDHMGADRFKKAARAIVNLAINADRHVDHKTGQPYPPADVLIIEKLAGLIPDAERERGINRALVSWNRGQLADRIRDMAKDAGLKVFEIAPHGTSQVCSKCGAMGRRYSVGRDESTGKPIIRFGWVEALFACPNARCAGRSAASAAIPFTCNADHNASVNLHRRFVLEDRAVTAYFTWKARPKAEQDRALRTMESELRPALEAMHGLCASEPQTPF
ncbi:MAG: hypothetical protein AMXMBFR58_02950 [Phycisphaerae bacterium]